MKIMKNYQNKHYTAKDQKDKKIGEKGFKFRMAEDGEAYRLSGYKFNAVTPFFMKDETLPIILSKEVANLDPAYFWLGGGRYTLKIGISVDDFKHYCGDRLIIEDIS
jgi:prolyl-tRNA editing enzyme YbaK/EbsC (Cys-tRNA(Pro) deacylase)